MCVLLCVFYSNVTPQSRLDLKLWSCHTLRKELLGSATIDLLDTLRTHDGKSKDTHAHTHLESLTREGLHQFLKSEGYILRFISPQFLIRYNLNYMQNISK